MRDILNYTIYSLTDSLYHYFQSDFRHVQLSMVFKMEYRGGYAVTHLSCIRSFLIEIDKDWVSNILYQPTTIPLDP